MAVKNIKNIFSESKEKYNSFITELSKTENGNKSKLGRILIYVNAMLFTILALAYLTINTYLYGMQQTVFLFKGQEGLDEFGMNVSLFPIEYVTYLIWILVSFKLLIDVRRKVIIRNALQL